MAQPAFVLESFEICESEKNSFEKQSNEKAMTNG